MTHSGRRTPGMMKNSFDELDEIRGSKSLASDDAGIPWTRGTREQKASKHWLNTIVADFQSSPIILVLLLANSFR